MAINTTTKEKPTGECNPTAGGAINDLDFPTSERSDKAFFTLRAAFALQGQSLYRTDPKDGPPTYWAERFEVGQYLPTIDVARRFLEQIGGRL